MTRRKALQGILIGLGNALASSPTRIEVGGATLDILIDSGQFALGDAGLIDWVKQSAKAVSAYYGKFPVPHARIHISVSLRGRVSNGKSFGQNGAHCSISVGQNATLADLRKDWELTHEMVHFSFPSVEERHHWIEEGIATYVEPIARASIGALTPEQVWGDMVRDMPQGLPAAGDQGLDNTHTWGRTYWGGALFCLMADIEIRKHTGNTKGLRDALRAINRAGGTIESDWPLERALAIGDKATDGKTLRDLYSEMALKPLNVDLPRLWDQLGIRRRDNGVTLDDNAPLAAIRAGCLS